MFRVKVVGTYIARSGVMEKEKVKKNYEIEGKIPTTVAALSIVKNKLLGPALAAKYDDYVTFLTYNITEIEPLDEASKTQMDKTEVLFMNREALLNFIKAHNVGACTFEVEKGKEKDFPQLNPTYYPSLFKLREAVQFAKDDPRGYQKHFAIHEADLRLDIEMATCNPELFNSSDPENFIATVSNVPPAVLVPAKASKPEVLVKKTDDRVSGLTAEMIKDGDLAPLDQAPDVGDL